MTRCGGPRAFVSRIQEPEWWNPNGYKMKLVDPNRTQTRLLIKGGGASFFIRRRRLPLYLDKQWLVNWRIHFSTMDRVSGQIAMDRLTLERAFGLQNGTDENSAWLLTRYKADSVKQGCFIRQGKFLNIPGPGTGVDGDVNVSLRLDPEIKIAVKEFLNK